MQAFLAVLSAKGFNLNQVILDGKIHRFDRNNGNGNAWYIGWQNFLVKDGSPYIVAEYGDWKTSENYIYKPENARLTSSDKQAIKVQLEESRKNAAEEKKKRQIEAAKKAEKYWESAKEIGETEYMRKKAIDQLYGARLYDGFLQVPVRDIEGKLWGLQYIAVRYKKFMTGARIDGCFHTIGKINGEAYLCEGFATGTSIHQATGKTVIVAFNANNLISVAKALRVKYPSLSITICGDDDRFTIVNGEPLNTGRITGDKAAMMAHGKAIYPAFESDDPNEGESKGPTDFNDLHIREGLLKVREQILGDDSEVKAGFLPIGYDEGNFYFYHMPSKDIVKANNFSKAQMFQIAPAEYWSERYPVKQGDADMSAAINDLIQMSKQVGPFDSTRIRGTGVWFDDGRVVVNLGHSLVVDGREMNLSSLKSWFIYIQTKNRLPPMSKPLVTEECKFLIDACLAFKWRDPKAGYLLAGWLFIARIAGALPIRPHVWLTGGSGSGKSTVMDRLIEPALGCPKGKIYLQGSSTEAGIRQRMKCSSVPPIFDEFETTGEGSKERVGNLVELLRNTWSATKGSVVKGSVSGNSVEYSLQFAALVSSIRVNLENDADRSRFSIIELAPHGNDSKHWSSVEKILMHITEEYGDRLFARAASMVTTIIKSQKVLSSVLAGQINQRYGQQVGMLLAGYWALTDDKPITRDIAEALIRELDLIEEKADSELTDEIECFTHLMSYKITLRNHLPMGGTEMKDMSIGDTILSSYHEQVRPYGIKLEHDHILIADNHAELSKIYKGTRWINWRISLKRIEGSLRSNPTRFCGVLSRATSLPMTLLKDSRK